MPAYSGAKSGVVNLHKNGSRFIFFTKTGIRVNAIAPGFFVTDQNRALFN
ncbi:MAG: hypothetical protein L6V93_14545 [Clostridiales bacterium]|nr:MAG: hypothetical protein L6V93_14545 [Clostridiales bacterium]